MADPELERRRKEFYARHHFLPEASWAATFCDLDWDQRQHFRADLRDPGYELDEYFTREGRGPYWRARWLVALDTLDLIDDPKPTSAVRKQACRILDRIAKG